MTSQLMSASPARHVQSMPHQRLDRDPSRLTTFPAPGVITSTFQHKEPVSEGRGNRIASPAKDRPPMSLSTQYWMPDHHCKACHDCGVAFSLFRRRHHCRLCGRIFCYECSSQFIDGTPHGHDGPIRVCELCSRSVLKADRKKAQQESEDSLGGRSSLTGSISGLDQGTTESEFEKNTVTPSPLLFAPGIEIADPLALTMDSEDTMFPLPSSETQETETNSISRLPPLCKSPSSPALRTKDSNDLQQAAPGRPEPPRKRRSSVELINAIESGGLLEAELKAILKRKREQAKAATPTMQSQREVALDKHMNVAHERIKSGIKLAVDAMATQLLEKDPMDLERLAATLEDIAFVVAGHMLFSMKFRSTTGFNYSSLVKVKSIAMADTVQKNVKEKNYQFKWLAGTVCRKHVSHKQMARQISNPRILLFACGISYDRSNGTGGGRLSSLDTLLEQEKSYMNILVDKITALEPDVIFVHRTVSRHAQELLRERGVAIVLNVKMEMLERISRHTGAALLTFVDHIDKANPEEVIGTCRSFKVKTIPTVPDDEIAQITPPKAVVPRNSMTGNSRLRTETFLYLDGCDPLNGCTVLITGSSKVKLRMLKRVTRGVLSMTYRLLLEAHVLSDLGLNRRVLSSRESIELFGKDSTTWYTSCTLRVRDHSNTKHRYHQCTGSRHFGILTYSDDDVSFGNFLNQEMGMMPLKCQNAKCNHLMGDHVHTFSCRTGTVTISFEDLPEQNKLPISNSLSQSSDGVSSYTDKSPSVVSSASTVKDGNVLSMLSYSPMSQPSSDGKVNSSPRDSEKGYPTVVFWRWCRECNGVVTPFIPLEKYLYKYSFARFLEIMFSEEDAEDTNLSSSICPHESLVSHVLFFNIGNSVARFDFEKKIPLRLTKEDCHLKYGYSTGENIDEEDKLVLKDAVSTRVYGLKELLETLVSLFMEKVQGVKQAVEAFAEQCEDCFHVQMNLEVMCLKKLIESDHKAFSYKLAKLESSAIYSLSACDATQRSMYLLACKWIDRMLKLRKLIKKNLSKRTNVMASASFTLGTFTFNTPTLSPVASPLNRDEGTQSVLTPSGISREVEWSERTKHGTSDGISINAPDSSPKSSAISSSTSSPTVWGSENLRTLSMPAIITSDKAVAKNGDSQEQSGWRAALWDLYRVIGRSAPGSEFDVELPAELLAGHPSLPYRSGDDVILVNHSEPITCVAYALSSDVYEEQLDSWKLIVHEEVAASVTSPRNLSTSHVPISTNWSRTALTSSLNTPFKHTICEVPLHISLLSGKSSPSTSNSRWEFSTIAYYPLQFEILRELFYGNHRDFLFSISHVNNWNTSGGKSGASFFRTLDDRFIIKHISSTELQSFLEVLPGYFKFMSKIYFDGEESILSKTVGLYQTSMTRKDTGQKTVHNICVMENAFYRKRIKQTFDLKGSSRNRYIKPPETMESNDHVLLDGNFLEYTNGHPMGVFAEDHEYILKAIKNDTGFLYSINIVDYSMVVGLGEQEGDQDSTEMTVGIIDYLRQFDLIKRMESVGKSMRMIAGQASPTIIEPGMYGKRFLDAIHRYFMGVTPVSVNSNDANERNE